MAKQLLASTNALIDKELARAEGIERRARNFSRHLGRSAHLSSVKSSQKLPRLNFCPAEVPTVVNDMDRYSPEIPDEQVESCRPYSHSPSLTPTPEPCDTASTSLSPDTHTPDSLSDFERCGNDEEPPTLQHEHNIRRYMKRIVDVTKNDKRMFHRERGEILFTQQFLVQIRETRVGTRIKELNNIPASIIKERSREYTAVARYTGRPEVPVAIYLYASDEVSRKIDHKWSRALKHKIYIDSSTQAAFFDTLDLSVAVWNCHKRNKNNKEEDGGRVFFLFMSQSVLVQVSWLYFLMHSSGNLSEPVVHVKIPDLNVSLQMQRGSIRLDDLIQEEIDTVTYTELLQPEASPSPFVREVHRRVLKVVSECSDMRTNRKFALCWRNIDFIRTMLFETNFHATSSHALLRQHTLELRVVHSLTTAQEPPPIEGFCWRLSTWRGQSRKQKLVTRNYLHTHNHLLFHLSPTKTILPNLGQGDESGENLKEYLQSLPIVCNVDPYPLDEANNIKWCVETEDPKVGKLHDARALFELARGASNIEASDGCVDMTTITEVKGLSNPQMFEITIENTPPVLIRVAEPEARDAWVERLRALVSYWKQLREQLRKDAKEVYQQNIAQNTNFILRSNTESNFATPNVSSFNIESVCRTRPIVYSNYLYKKSHKHGFFRRYYAVLTSSSIVLYSCQSNSHSMKNTNPQGDTHFTLHSVFDLLRTYVYSGILAHDYLSRESEDSFDFAQMYNGVPRVFENEWVIQDREADCCFILWNDNSRKSRSKTREGTYEGKLVCMARSRIERDLWISALQNVTTALSLVRDQNAATPKPAP